MNKESKQEFDQIIQRAQDQNDDLVLVKECCIMENIIAVSLVLLGLFTIAMLTHELLTKDVSFGISEIFAAIFWGTLCFITPVIIYFESKKKTSFYISNDYIVIEDGKNKKYSYYNLKEITRLNYCDSRKDAKIRLDTARGNQIDLQGRVTKISGNKQIDTLHDCFSFLEQTTQLTSCFNGVSSDDKVTHRNPIIPQGEESLKESGKTKQLYFLLISFGLFLTFSIILIKYQFYETFALSLFIGSFVYLGILLASLTSRHNKNDTHNVINATVFSICLLIIGIVWSNYVLVKFGYIPVQKDYHNLSLFILAFGNMIFVPGLVISSIYFFPGAGWSSIKLITVGSLYSVFIWIEESLNPIIFGRPIRIETSYFWAIFLICTLEAIITIMMIASFRNVYKYMMNITRYSNAKSFMNGAFMLFFSIIVGVILVPNLRLNIIGLLNVFSLGKLVVCTWQASALLHLVSLFIAGTKLVSLSQDKKELIMNK